MYVPKTKHFSHQAEWLEKTWDLERYAIFWEQGTGKSKLLIDTAARLWLEGAIDAVLIVAPNSVHTNWVIDEIPAHLPDEVAERSRVFCYQTGKSATQWHQAEVRYTLGHQGLSWLSMSYNGFMTKRGKKAAWDFLRKRRVLYILDESMFIKTPGTKRAKSVVASARHAPFRRILCGTPIANSPFDAYTQIRFLDPGFWRRELDVANAQAFRNYFGIFATRETESGKTMQFPVDFRFLDELSRLLKSISTRVLKEDVLDLPPKLYSKRYFELSAEQRKLYKAVRDDFMVELDNGELVTAPLVITRMLRLQQIACGYLPVDDPNAPLYRIDDGNNRRLGVVEDFVDTVPHQAIIWANWNEDIDQIMDLVGKRGVRFDGQVKMDQRERNKRIFKAGDAQFFVSKSSVAGTGHTLTEAKSCMYYNNSFSLVNRLQSEDRAHRINQDQPVNYTDVIAQGTLDEHVVRALRKKFNVASQVTGDVAREWI